METGSERERALARDFLMFSMLRVHIPFPVRIRNIHDSIKFPFLPTRGFIHHRKQVAHWVEGGVRRAGHV